MSVSNQINDLQELENNQAEIISPEPSLAFNKINDLQIELENIQAEMIKTAVEIAYILDNGIVAQEMLKVRAISLQALEKSRQTIKARIVWWRSVFKSMRLRP